MSFHKGFPVEVKGGRGLRKKIKMERRKKLMGISIPGIFPNFLLATKASRFIFCIVKTPQTDVEKQLPNNNFYCSYNKRK
jgi:hypothetical protein